MTTLVAGADVHEVPLEHRHVICPAHGEPLRAEFPRGWAEFSTIVATRALESPALQTGAPQARRYWREDGLLWGDLPAAVGAAVIRRLLEDRPACEWLRPEELLAAYMRSGIGRSGICRVCGVIRSGTPYGVVSGRGRNVIAHVCFVCVVNGRTRA